MTQGRPRGWRRLLGRPADLEPPLFWLYLACCGLAAVLNVWSFARHGGWWALGLALLFSVLGVRALRIALRRRRSGAKP